MAMKMPKLEQLMRDRPLQKEVVETYICNRKRRGDLLCIKEFGILKEHVWSVGKFQLILKNAILGHFWWDGKNGIGGNVEKKLQIPSFPSLGEGREKNGKRY